MPRKEHQLFPYICNTSPGRNGPSPAAKKAWVEQQRSINAVRAQRWWDARTLREMSDSWVKGWGFNSPVLGFSIQDVRYACMMGVFLPSEWHHFGLTPDKSRNVDMWRPGDIWLQVAYWMRTPVWEVLKAVVKSRDDAQVWALVNEWGMSLWEACWGARRMVQDRVSCGGADSVLSTVIRPSGLKVGAPELTVHLLPLKSHSLWFMGVEGVDGGWSELSVLWGEVCAMVACEGDGVDDMPRLFTVESLPEWAGGACGVFPCAGFDGVKVGRVARIFVSAVGGVIVDVVACGNRL